MGGQSKSSNRYTDDSQKFQKLCVENISKNCRTLYTLTYPEGVMLATIEGRSNSVPESNFVCEWMERKTKQISRLEDKGCY
jgi:hypothetical protein